MYVCVRAKSLSARLRSSPPPPPPPHSSERIYATEKRTLGLNSQGCTMHIMKMHSNIAALGRTGLF